MRLMVPLALGCVLALLPASAFAASELGLSSDRVHWSSDLSTPLFDPDFRWVPGDSETSSFWVRNQSRDPARLDVSMLGSSVDSLMRTGDLSVSVKAADGSGSSATTVGQHALISSRMVDPGQDERIDVTVAFDPAATNQSQVKEFDLQFAVLLTQDAASRPGGGTNRGSDGDRGNGDSDGSLPGTGSSIARSSLLIAAALIVVGAGLAGFSRPKEKIDA